MIHYTIMLAETRELSQREQLISAQDTVWLRGHPTEGNEEVEVFPRPPQPQGARLGLLPWPPLHHRGATKQSTAEASSLSHPKAPLLTAAPLYPTQRGN